MYNVSEAYKVAMKRPVQQGRVRGTLQSGLSSYDFTENNIKKGTFGLTNQCSGNDNVEIGTVYTAELSMILIGMEIERYSLQKSVIIPRHELRTDNGYEAIPLGVFNIKEADWTMEGADIKAYDNMIKLDKNCNFKTTQGRVYDFLTMAANACGIELAQEQADIEALPNGNKDLTFFVENDIETWRDVVSWCAQTTGTFAIMNREGKLQLCIYNQDPVDEIGADRRITGARFSDYTTRYTGMSCVNIAEKTITYYNVTPDDGLTYNLGSNPLLQTGFEDVITELRRNVLNALTIIDYVPMEVSMICPPVYDLGDVVIFKDGIADEDKLSCITKFDWKSGGAYKITGVGKNPALASARSKSDKDITGLMKSGEENKIQYYTFTNADDIDIRDGETATIINIRFQCTQPTVAIFHAEVLADIETTVDDITYSDAVGHVVYWFNESPVADYEPKETWQDGKHTLHLLYYFNLQNTQINDFDVRLNMAGGSAFIKQMNIKAAIYGQNLYATDKFDGIIKIEEDFSGVEPTFIPSIVPSISMLSNVSSELFARMTEGFSDDMSDVVKTLETLTVTSMSSDSVEVDTE